MAFPWAAAMGAGSGIASPIISSIANNNANIKSARWNEDMYKWQMGDQERLRNQDREYNEGLWNKQNAYMEKRWNIQNQYNENRWKIENEYNSPEQQMARFRAAGLNPNLIYGQGNSGGSVSAAPFSNDSPTPSRSGSANAGSPRFTPSNFNFQDGIMSYFAIREQQARTNNLEATNEVIKLSAAYKAAETAAKIQDTSRSTFDLALAKDLRQGALLIQEATLRKLNVESDTALSRNEREQALSSSSIREATERILNMRGERYNKALDASLKQYEINLNKMGVQKGDKTWERGLGYLINQMRNGNYDGKAQNSYSIEEARKQLK